MTGISSRTADVPDISSERFRASARDVGEVIAYLAGGVKPDPETLSRLLVSLRGLQGFLLNEAVDQAGREAITEDGVIAAAVDRLFPVRVSFATQEGAHHVDR